VVQNFKHIGDRNVIPLFNPTSGDRRLRVVVDAEALQSARAADAVAAEQFDVLKGLLALDLIDVWQVDGAKVAGIDAVSRGERPEVRRGWVEVGPARPDDYATHHVLYWEGDHLHLRGISGDVGRGELARQDPTYAHLDPDAAGAARNQDSVILGAADALGADLLITDRPFLLGPLWFPNLRPVRRTPADALALVGQFLRLRGTYCGWAQEHGGVSLTFNRGLYFWVATRALLPEGWRWFSHCIGAAGPGPEDDVVHTAQSVLHRVERTLRERETLRWTLTLKQTNDTGDDALAAVDHILVDLVGAFDATARIAHRALSLPEEDEWHAGWQKSRWLKEVTKKAPDLAAVMRSGETAADVFEVIRIMRNTVHGAGLQAMGVGRLSGVRQGTVVGLPVAATKRLTEIVERRGWGDLWGLKEFTDDRVFVDPGAFIEHVLPAVFRTINDLMRLTPVESLAAGPVSNANPPRGDSLSDPFALRHQRSLLHQFGFSEFTRARVTNGP
jgi:hypothetical protein